MRTDSDEVDRVRAIYDRGGSAVAGGDGEGFLLAGARDWLRERAQGDTLEVGIGGGRTLAWYPPEVRLTAVDVSGVMLAQARRRATAIGRDVSFEVADGAALPFSAGSFDTVVFCLSLCTIPDDRQTLSEAARVLRPGGRLLAVEHVRSPHRLVRLLERLWEPIALRTEGDHMLRDPLDHLAGTGLRVERVERLRLGIMERLEALKPAD